MRGEALLLCCKIILVDLAPHEIQPCVIRRDPAAPAPKVRIEDLISRLCVPGKDPRIERDGLLRWVDSAFFCMHPPPKYA